MKREIEFDGCTWEWSWWNGQTVKGTAEKPASFDLETRLIRPAWQPAPDEDPKTIPADPLDVPEASLGMVYDGESLYLLHPSKFASFFAKNRHTHLCGHNVQFDVWSLLKHEGEVTQQIIWELGASGRLHDSLCLDMLLQLGTGNFRGAFGVRNADDTKIYPVGLGKLSEELKTGELDKHDEYRLRFGELLGLSQEEIENHAEAAGFIRYALPDAIVTYRVWPILRERALELMRRCGWREGNPKTFEIRPDSVKKWGPLGEAVQVRGSIALAELSRQPLRIDQERRAEMEAKARERYGRSLEILLKFEPDLVKRYVAKKRAGEVKMTKKSLNPQFDQKALVRVLEAEAERMGVEIPKSDGKLKGTSTSAKVWAKYEEGSEFIKAWRELENTGKLLEFLTGMNADRLYSYYSLLMRTGRTSAGSHKRGKKVLVPSLNVQQIPRPDKDDPLKNVRTLITADPGHMLYTVDIVYAELRTLAASCLARFGFSKLADTVKAHTLKGGLDPHEKAALTVLNMTEQEYRSKPKGEQKKIRQSIKAFSFGVPGGLGAEKLCLLAANNYDVHLTRKQAKESKEKFLEAYPEIGKQYHLADHMEDALAYQLNLPKCAIPKLRDFQRLRYSFWLKGDAELTEPELDGFWNLIESLAKRANRDDLVALARKRELVREIKNLFLYRGCTLTGLIRANANYSQAANLPMQSGCASAAKEVLYALMRKGYCVKIYLHDEFVIQVKENGATAAVHRLERLINQTLEDCIGMGIPMAVEGGLGRTWQKV
jgi:hypothetical protein